MTPGNPRILTCPFCGGEKTIMSLASGNTLDAELWSDNKQIAPMLPEVSYIQKCPHCGKYYIISRQETRYAESGWTLETGTLTFPEMKEALSQFMKEGFYEGEEPIARMMFHHSYNDYYYRSVDDKVVNPNDFIFFRYNAIWLIRYHIKDDIMKAEFYREIKEFSRAKRIIESTNAQDDFHKGIVSAIQQRIDNKDSEVFKIQEHETIDSECQNDSAIVNTFEEKWCVTRMKVFKIGYQECFSSQLHKRW